MRIRGIDNAYSSINKKQGGDGRPKILSLGGLILMLSKKKLVEIISKKEDNNYDEFIKKSRIVTKVLDFYYNWNGNPETLDFSCITFKELLIASEVIYEHDETDYDNVLLEGDPISHMLFVRASVHFFKSIPSSGVVDYL